LKKEEFAKKIPAESGVVASFEFLPRLANRKNLFSFHNVTTGQYPYSQRKFMAPEIVKYALIDFSDPLTMNSFYNIESDSRIKDFLSESEMRAIEIADTVVLFERAAKNSVNLFEIMQDKPVPPEDTPLSINNSIRFLGFGKKGLISQDNLNFIFYWASVKNSDDDIGICFDIIDDKNQLFFRFIRPICYNIYPTYRWQQGQFVKIGFSLILPRSLPQGKYTLLLGFVDYRKKRKIFPVSLKENILNNQGQVRLATFSVN
jgi:hypothetical protein